MIWLWRGSFCVFFFYQVKQLNSGRGCVKTPVLWGLFQNGFFWGIKPLDFEVPLFWDKLLCSKHLNSHGVRQEPWQEPWPPTKLASGSQRSASRGEGLFQGRIWSFPSLSRLAVQRHLFSQGRPTNRAKFEVCSVWKDMAGGGMGWDFCHWFLIRNQIIPLISGKKLAETNPRISKVDRTNCGTSSIGSPSFGPPWGRDGRVLNTIDDYRSNLLADIVNTIDL